MEAAYLAIVLGLIAAWVFNIATARLLIFHILEWHIIGRGRFSAFYHTIQNDTWYDWMRQIKGASYPPHYQYIDALEKYEAVAYDNFIAAHRSMSWVYLRAFAYYVLPLFLLAAVVQSVPVFLLGFVCFMAFFSRGEILRPNPLADVLDVQALTVTDRALLQAGYIKKPRARKPKPAPPLTAEQITKRTVRRIIFGGSTIIMFIAGSTYVAQNHAVETLSELTINTLQVCIAALFWCFVVYWLIIITYKLVRWLCKLAVRILFAPFRLARKLFRVVTPSSQKPQA